MVDINLATNIELIEELTNRATFVGAVIYSVDEHKFSHQTHSRFGMQTRCGDTESCRMLLEIMTTKLEELK